MNKIRIVAQWVVKNGLGPDGEWDPYRDTYGETECLNVSNAKRMAVARGKKAGVTEWAGVARQEFDPVTRQWSDVEVWRGDWVGNWWHQDCLVDA